MILLQFLYFHEKTVQANITFRAKRDRLQKKFLRFESFYKNAASYKGQGSRRFVLNVCPVFCVPWSIAVFYLTIYPVHSVGA